MGNFQEVLGINEVSSSKVINVIWKALLAEFLGNFLLNFFGCGSVVVMVTSGGNLHPPNFVIPAITFGLVIFVCVQTGLCPRIGAGRLAAAWRMASATFKFLCGLFFREAVGGITSEGVQPIRAVARGTALGHVSGAHLNPAVTVGMLSVGNIKIIKAVLYIIVQCIGALAGSATLKALLPEDMHGSGMGNTTLNPMFSPLQGFGLEFFLGFVLVLVVSGVCDPNRPEAKAAGPLAIGLAVALGHLGAIGFTGSSMNPARSFGSAVIAGVWDHHWIYWVGPIVGGIVAALIYHHALRAPTLTTVKIIERYSTVADEKELRRLDTNKDNDNFA